MDDVDVSPMFRLIGRLTAEHAGPGGCWPTRARVASQAGCSPRTVSRAWAALEAMGILHRRINAGAPGRGDLGGRRPNLITWAADVWEKGRQLLRDRRDRGTRRRLAAKAKAKADRRHPCQPTPDTGVNLKSQGRSQVQSESLVTVGDARKRDYDQLRDEIRRRKPPIL
jgi:AraC-like DNA-binding protein